MRCLGIGHMRALFGALVLFFSIGTTAAPTCREIIAGTKEISYAGVSFRLTSLSKERGFVPLTARPKLSPSFDPQSQIAKDLDTIWDFAKFGEPRAPQRIAALGKGAAEFSIPNDIRILDMPIKMKGSSEIRLPAELAQFRDVIQKIIDHEFAMLPTEVVDKYYAYLTIDQSVVEPGSFQRKPGAHVDGFQGARIVEKNEVNHSYIVTDGIPTVFYPQKFDFSKLDVARHDYFREMDRTADESQAMRISKNEIWLMDAYSVHRADIATERTHRTFLRLSFDVKEFDRLGNTINPHFEYNWEMKARDVHATLEEYKPIEQCRRCGMCPRGRALQNGP